MKFTWYTAMLISALSNIGHAATNDQIILSCTETKTYVDSPGRTYRVSANLANNNAFIISKAVADRRNQQDQSWQIDTALAVAEKVADNGLVVRTLVAPIDWERTEACYVFTPTISFRLDAAQKGTFAGKVKHANALALDPSQQSTCSYPQLTPPAEDNVECVLY